MLGTMGLYYIPGYLLSGKLCSGVLHSGFLPFRMITFRNVTGLLNSGYYVPEFFYSVIIIFGILGTYRDYTFWTFITPPPPSTLTCTNMATICGCTFALWHIIIYLFLYDIGRQFYPYNMKYYSNTSTHISSF